MSNIRKGETVAEHESIILPQTNFLEHRLTYKELKYFYIIQDFSWFSSFPLYFIIRRHTLDCGSSWRKEGIYYRFTLLLPKDFVVLLDSR